MSDSLKEKTVKGVSWTLVDNVANLGISFVVGIILARLLTPEEYGIMAIITVFIAVANTIVDSGFSSALVRKTAVQRVDYDTVFHFNLIVSIVLYVLLYLSAPWISTFFHEDLLVPVLRVMGLVLIVNSLAIIQRTILVRRIDFKTQTIISFIASVFSGLVGVTMAFTGWGVWSLVGQFLVRQILYTLMIWVYGKWTPTLSFSWISFREMFGFGSKLLVSGLLDTLYKNIYYLVIGRFYSSAELGQYTRAEHFNMLFSNNLTTSIQRVSYPALSSIQDNPERLKQGYRKMIKMTMLITFACILGLAAVAKPLILILIGEKWLPAVGYLQIICFSGMLYPLHAINLNILQVKGRSDLFLKLEIIKKTMAVGPIALGIFYGIEYMLWGSVLTSFVAYFLNSYYSADLINYSTKSQIKDILPTFMVSLCVAGVMWGVSFWNVSIYLILPVQVLIGLLLASFIYERLHLDEYLEAKQIMLSTLKRK